MCKSCWKRELQDKIITSASAVVFEVMTMLNIYQERLFVETEGGK
jgi:hypothetical protein